MTKAEHDRKYYLKNKEKRLAYSKEYQEKNKDKIKELRKEYYEKNKASIKEKHVKHRLNFYYGLSLEDYLTKIKNQKGLCACCKEPFIKTPNVDHCHTSGKVRGLLCTSCNTGLGFYEKKSNLFKVYLEEYPT